MTVLNYLIIGHDHSSQRRFHGVGVEGRSADQESVQQATKTPDVSFQTMGTSSCDLSTSIFFKFSYNILLSSPQYRSKLIQHG